MFILIIYLFIIIKRASPITIMLWNISKVIKLLTYNRESMNYNENMFNVK